MHVLFLKWRKKCNTKFLSPQYQSLNPENCDETWLEKERLPRILIASPEKIAKK